jgi:simple sugar transport system ATP-binding protein
MGKKQFINWTYIRKAAREALEWLGVDIDVRKNVSELTLAEKQMILLASASRERCKFLMLDEPTAPLSHTETENLFKAVRYLAQKKGVGVVFISHRLAELFEICEYITIMRDGQIVTSMDITPELTIAQLVEYMLGRKIDETYKKTVVPIGDMFFEVDNLTEAEGRVKNINLTVRKGEIIGIAGLVGAGKTELCKTIFGAYKISSGSVNLNGRIITAKSPTEAVKRSLAFAPEERRKEGVIVTDPIYANITIASLHKFINKFGFVIKGRQYETTRKMIGDLGIKTPSEYQQVAYLSGGNQQKVVVAKWLVSDSEIYIFDEPTKGVDVGAKRDIFRLINDLVGQGKGIIYASCEFSEIMAIADRAYVMYDGEIVKELNVSETSEKELLYYSTGGN